ISIFEYFFKETFKVLLRYNWEKNDSILKERIKVTYRDLLDIEKGDQTIEYILSKEWNFQNLDIINTVFYKYFKLDIFKVLAKRKKVNNKFYFVKNKLEEIIKKRHSVIHELELDNEVNKETFFETLLILKISFSLIVNELNNKNNWNLQDFS
ncbi:MAG: hypothetical protein RAO94_01780, partial [Candidatus Stygibacter australis]|nr:hypothetical protein [Candidatus Stygibacter australis]